MCSEPRSVRKIRALMAGQTAVDYHLADLTPEDLDEAAQWAWEDGDDELLSLVDDELAYREAKI